jgi:hypothetical protein
MRYRCVHFGPSNERFWRSRTVEYPASAEALRQQIDTARVISFENSGSGFFSYLAVAADAPLLTEKSPLNGAYGNVIGIEHGMGFIVFSDRRTPLHD